MTSVTVAAVGAVLVLVAAFSVDFMLGLGVLGGFLLLLGLFVDFEDTA
jgi:hypothetical protein